MVADCATRMPVRLDRGLPLSCYVTLGPSMSTRLGLLGLRDGVGPSVHGMLRNAQNNDPSYREVLVAGAGARRSGEAGGLVRGQAG